MGNNASTPDDSFFDPPSSEKADKHDDDTDALLFVRTFRIYKKLLQMTIHRVFYNPLRSN